MRSKPWPPEISSELSMESMRSSIPIRSELLPVCDMHRIFFDTLLSSQVPYTAKIIIVYLFIFVFNPWDLKLIIIIIINNNTWTMFMVLSSWHKWQVIARVHPLHLTNADQCQMAADPQTWPTDLGCESACRLLYGLHTPLRFIITQPESWYSFYCPTKCGRLSQHRHIACNPIWHKIGLHCTWVWETCPSFLHSSDLARSQTSHLWCASPTLYQ